MNLTTHPVVCLLLCLILCTAAYDGSEYGNQTDANNQASIQDQDLPPSNTPSWQRPATKARWGAPSDPQRAAWVVVVSNDNLTRHYYDLLLANLECLRQTNSQYEVALLYEGELDVEMQTAFKALNVSKLFRYPDYFVKKGIDISALEEKSTPARENGHMWHKSWNKLAAWALPRYDKVVVMDPDVIAWANGDAVFQYPQLSAVPDYGIQLTREDHMDTFNSGFMVIQPSMRTFRRMMSILPSYTSWFVDQGFLNDFFRMQWRALPLAYQLWPGMVQHGIKPVLDVGIVKFVHHVSESACWECDLGWKTDNSCEQHVCPKCCHRVVQCRSQAYQRIAQYKRDHGLYEQVPFTHGIFSHAASHFNIPRPDV